jgi:1-acyl-sn-glycerol-3-phosphate acyltransferase
MGRKTRRLALLYWIFKWTLFGWAVRLLFKPWIEGRENLPQRGPAILVSNHISAGDTFLLPAMIRRRLTFPAKVELFHGRGFKGRLLSAFIRGVGMVPLDRSGGRASAGSMDSVLGILKSGKLFGIFPEGTRSPDGRLYKGKTGVARLVLQADVPVIPVAMINTQLVSSKFFGIPTMRRPGIRIGRPMDFSAYAGAGNDREVLRWITDEIMNAVMELSGQVYVDAYGASVKGAMEEGRDFDAKVLSRPGEGRIAPQVPVPAPAAEPAEATQDVSA